MTIRKNLMIILLCLGGLLLMTGCAGSMQAEMKFIMEKWNEAIPLYNQHLAQKPDDYASRSKLGFAYFKTGQLEKAAEEFSSALKGTPDDPYSIYYLGLTYLNMNEFGKAAATWQAYRNETAPLVEEEITRQLTLLLIAESQRAAAKALEEEKKLSTLKPDKNTVAVCYYEDLSPDKSLKNFQKALAAMVITDLSKVKSLKVVERLRLQALLEEIQLGQTGIVDGKTAPRVGRLLGAGNLVIGNLSKGSIKVTTSLTGDSGGTASVTVDEEKFFELPGVIIRDALKILKIKLTPEEQKTIGIPQTKVYEAFIHYGKALIALDSGNWKEAKNFFISALRADPKFSLAENGSNSCPAPSSPDIKTLKLMKPIEIIKEIEAAVTRAETAQEKADAAETKRDSGGDSGGGGGGHY